LDEHLRNVAAHYDQLAETYDQDYFGRDSLYHRITMDHVRRFLPAQKDVPVLDAGAGTGVFTVELAKLGYRVLLTDISRGMLKEAREKVAKLGLQDLVKIVESDIRSMPMFEDSSFAMVLCEGDPLSYCGDHEAALREFVRVVKPGGVVTASVDNRAAALKWLRNTDDREAVERLLSKGDVFMPYDDGIPPHVVHAFTPEELRALFEANGLSVERIIGKPVLSHRLRGFDSRDRAVHQWLYRLELKYNANAAYLPWAGHLEIAGRKV
jgi:ubiquinone/menaquinone biosynthesis C-methylase UbiE